MLLSRDRQVVYSFHETFEMVDEMLEFVDQLIEKESEGFLDKHKFIASKFQKIKAHSIKFFDGV